MGEKATAGIIAPVGGPHTVNLTCLPAYSAFSSDNAGSPTVKNHEMFFFFPHVLRGFDGNEPLRISLSGLWSSASS